MIESWIDKLTKVWELDDGKGNLVWSPRIFEKEEFPDALPELDRPVALTFIVSTSTQYSAGGPCINITQGFTEFHFPGGLGASARIYTYKFIGKIQVAAAANVKLSATVEHFLLTSEGQPSIQGPVSLQYGEEAEHWGLVVRWEVKENVTGQLAVTA